MSEKKFRARDVFISYRRDGGQAHAVNFCHRLQQVLGEDRVFLDVTRHAMDVGGAWRSTVRESLSRCDTLLLILDPGMTGCLMDRDNAVRFELESAFQLGLRIVLVRVDNAVMPTADDLPESLRELPDLHSPEVHRDAAVADLDRIVEWLTGISPGTLKPLDRWDVTILVGLAIIAVIGWMTWARDLFSVGEAWLWGAALGTPWILWMLVRRWVFSRGEKRAVSNRRHALGWLVVLALFCVGWSAAWSAVYRLPEFADQAGVLVSRLENDPRGVVQEELLDYFRSDDQITDDTSAPTIARKLPRRVGFASRALPWIQDDNGHNDARRLGKSSGALVVLWGEIQSAADFVSTISANLTFVGSLGVFQRPNTNVIGKVELRELDSLDGDIAVLGEVLSRFFDGYHAFYSATDETGLKLARSKFRDALNEMDGRMVQPGDSDALRDIRATLLFYMGNAELALENLESAAGCFLQSMREAQWVNGGDFQTRYVHAANNLGWLQIKAGQYSMAIETFDTTELECAEMSTLRACAYVWYNRGDAEDWLGNYSEAEKQFERAIKRIRDRGLDENDWALEAQAHQYRAYSLVRQAALVDKGGRSILLDRADEAWRAGAAVYEKRNLAMPEHHRITVARIYIERGEYESAIELLSSLEVPNRQITIETLLAAAYACVGDVENQFGIIDALASMTDANDVQTTIDEAFDEIARIEAECQ